MQLKPCARLLMNRSQWTRGLMYSCEVIILSLQPLVVTKIFVWIYSPAQVSSPLPLCFFLMFTGKSMKPHITFGHPWFRVFSAWSHVLDFHAVPVSYFHFNLYFCDRFLTIVFSGSLILVSVNRTLGVLHYSMSLTLWLNFRSTIDEKFAWFVEWSLTWNSHKGWLTYKGFEGFSTRTSPWKKQPITH